MKNFKQGKNGFNVITFNKRLFKKIIITVLTTIVFIATGTLTFASTLYFTDGVHNGTSVNVGDNWTANESITPSYGSGSTTINGLTVPYHIQHAWMDGGNSMNHYAQLNYVIGYEAWYWYWSSCEQASWNDGDKLTLDANDTYTATLHTRPFKNGVTYYTNTSISNTSSGTLGANEYGGRNVTLPTQSMKTCYVNFNGNGGTPSTSSTSYNYSFSKYKCSTSSQYTLYTNVVNGWDYAQETSVIVPIATSWNNDNSTATMTFTSYYNRPEISLATATRTGYIFTGWNTEPNGTGTSYLSKISSASDITSPDISTDLTLYAQWTPITYTVQYNGNGATGGSTGNSNHTYDAQNNLSYNGYERKYTVSFNGNGGTTPSNKTSSYAFYRWRQYANATGWSFTSGQTNVGNLSSTNGATVTLYAQWSPTSITLPSTSRNAYSFAGWYYGSSRIGGIGDSYTPTSNIALTAQWNLITKSISGKVNWNDQNNKYNSRPKNESGIETVNVTLNSDEPITETATGALATPNTQTVVGENYTFSNLQRYKTRDNTEYTYTVTQNVVPGYETVINGYNITNNLILPTYTSNITYTPVNSFENRLLKNGKVKVTGEVIANINNRDSVGLNQGKATFTIDSGINIDTSKIKVKYYEASTNTTYNLTNYTVNGNVITAIYGKDANGISQKGDKITIELEGTLNKIGQYSSNIIATGNLRDYRGTNTTINLGQVTNTSKTAQVDYQLPKANLKIQKVDSITNENLTDATFTLYEWDGSKYVQKEVITDTNKDGIYESSYYEWNITTNGKYRVEETGIPENYKDLKWSMQYNLNQLKTEDYTVKPDYSNSEYNITYGVRTPDSYDNIDGVVENEPWKLKAKIEKVDLQTNNTIQSETEFTIYEWNEDNSSYEVFTSKVTGEEVKMVRQSDKTYVSGEWLYYSQNNKGKYRIIETKAPEGYFANYDEEKEKVTYDIDIVETVKTGKFEDQNIENEGTVIISNNTELTLTNKRQKARLNITVVDKETEGKAQADSTLEGAKYGIYALEDIYHADGVTTRYEGIPGLIYKKDELIQTQITNVEGKFTFDDLECGKYYVKMIQAPEGYLLDENKYGVDFSYQGEAVELIEANGTIGIQVKKQAFQIYKLKEDSTILSNAGFSIYLVNDLSIVKEGKISKITTERYSLNDTTAQNDERIKQKQNADGTYYLKDLVDYYYKIVYEEGQEQILPGDNNVYHPYNLTSETVQKDYSSSKEGQTIPEIRTNTTGYMKSPELAYGEYVVIETSVPRAQDAANPFVIKVEQDSRDLQDIRFIKDDDFRTKVKLYIRDVQTQNTILNKTIQYVIKNIDTQKYMTHKIWVPNEGYVEYGTPDKPFETQKTGYIITPMKLPIGQYELIEIAAAEGYTTNKFEGSSVNGQTQFAKRDNLKFEINTNTAYYTDTYLGSYIIVVNETNKSVVGDIKIKAQGEYLSKATMQEDGSYKLEYSNGNISEIKYQIIAKEDIYTQDNQGSKIYNKDEVIGYVTTDENGEGIIENLPLGKYIIKEVEIVEGFALNTETKEVEISYEGQEVPVVFESVEQNEIRQKIEIIIHNKDIETDENRQGGKYGLYTKEEITYTDINGNTKTIPANTLLQTANTNEESEIKFNAEENIDLPQGKYYVKEIEAPEGYVLKEEAIDIDTTKDNNKEIVLKIEKDILGEKTSLIVKDINEQQDFVSGSKLEIVEKQTGNVIESWETQGREERFRKLKTDTEYIVRQTKPADGYVTAEEVEFIIKTNGKVQINNVEQEENIINIISRVTKLDVVLKDELDGSNASGVKLKIVNKETEEIVTWIMPNEPQRIEGLPIGKYTIKEIELPEGSGYVTIEDVDFEVRDNPEIQQVIIVQNVSKLEVDILDELDSTKRPEGTKWQIVNKNTGLVADEWVQDENKHEVKKIPIGNYTLREVELPESSGYVTIEDVDFEIKDTLEVQKVEVVQSVSKLEVDILDELDRTKRPEGTKWQIISKIEKEDGTIEEVVVDEWIQDENKHEVKKLPIGDYTLREVELPEGSGYVTNEDVDFEIKDTLEVQKVEVVQSVSKLEVDILDELDSIKRPEGTKWQIISKIEKEDGTIEEKVVDEWLQDENKHEVKKLPIGDYTLREVELPEGSGYVTNEDVDFEIKDTLEVQRVEVVQSVSKLAVDILDELDSTKRPEGTKWQIVSKIEKEDGTIEEKVVDEWIQDENKHEVKKLPIGNYTLREVELPEGSGYVTNEDVDFEIKDTLEVQRVEVVQNVTKLQINIVDELDSTKRPEGTKWQIISKIEKEDGTIEEVVVDEWIQDENKHQIKKLPIGNYTLREVELPEGSGYVTNEDVDFEIKDTLEVQKVEVVQSVSKLEVDILDELDSTKRPEGTKWQIVSKIEKEDGTIEEVVVDEWLQDENKHEVKKLPIGDYTLREVELPEGSGYVTNEDVDFEIKDTLEVQKVEVVQSVSKLEVDILDELDSTKRPEGTKWQIVSKIEKEDGTIEEVVVDEWIQDENKHEVKKLPIGNYTLREVELPEGSGYVTNEDVDFEIKDTLEVQKVEVVQSISKVNIKILDIQTEEDITESVDIKILNKDTKEIVASTKVENGEKLIEKTEEGYYIEKLPIGTYIIIETSIDEKKGYVEYKEVDMEVKDTLEVQKIEIHQDISKLLIKVIDEETKEIIPEVKLQILDKETRKVIAKTIEKQEDEKDEDTIVDSEEKDTTDEIQENIENVEENTEQLEESKEDTEESKEDTEESKEDIEQPKENTEGSEENIESEEKIIEILETEEGYYIERLPIGEYILVQETKDGYHEVEEKQIKIENTKEKQEVEIINTRLQYDIRVDKQLEKIIFDGEETIINDTEARKIEVKERKIATADLKLQYVIRITNSGETDVKVGTIVDKLPDGFELVANQSNGWTMDKNLATYKGYENEVIKPGETKEVHITTKWKNSVTNFGDKTNIAVVINSSNPYGYEDKNKDNNEGKSIVVISVGTGIETAVTAARIVMVTFIGSMTICLIAGVEMLIKERKQKK